MPQLANEQRDQRYAPDRCFAPGSSAKPVAFGSVSADEFQITRRKAVALFELPKASWQSE